MCLTFSRPHTLQCSTFRQHRAHSSLPAATAASASLLCSNCQIVCVALSPSLVLVHMDVISLHMCMRRQLTPRLDLLRLHTASNERMPFALNVTCSDLIRAMCDAFYLSRLQLLTPSSIRVELLHIDNRPKTWNTNTKAFIVVLICLSGSLSIWRNKRFVATDKCFICLF